MDLRYVWPLRSMGAAVAFGGTPRLAATFFAVATPLRGRRAVAPFVGRKQTSAFESRLMAQITAFAFSRKRMRPISEWLPCGDAAAVPVAATTATSASAKASVMCSCVLIDPAD